jgi:leucyl aminopeptidase
VTISFLTENTKGTISVVPLTPRQLDNWVGKQTKSLQNWIESTGFTAEPGSLCLIQDAKGKLTQVLAGISGEQAIWDYAHLPAALPPGRYVIDKKLSRRAATGAALGWSLGTYSFSRYNKRAAEFSTLAVSKACDLAYVESATASVFLIRDLINTPALHMGPAELSAAAESLAGEFDADFSEIVGTDLVEQNYPAIFAVGMGSDRAPRLLDMTWGNAKAPKVTLVGKGVCFDSGGLDIKPAGNMRLMKKDMGGAAHVLGLARMIMAANLPVRLRVLIPAVENSVSGRAMRPLDVVPTRSGKTIEIGNTDAEGRVVLADALAEGSRDNPALMIDMATLTGAARAALGTDLPALFGNDDALAQDVVTAGREEGDPVWQMPLWQPYRQMIDSRVADLSNDSNSPYGGAITAALFLQEFVGPKIPWLHLDLMAWNTSARAGRPEGGEAMALRALFHLIAKRWPAKKVKSSKR